MLAGGLDAAYRSILAGPHKQVCRVEVWAGGERIDTYGNAGVPYNQGSVSATLTSRVARVLSLTLDRSLFPSSPTDLLAPFGNYLKVFSGVDNGSGVPYIWQVFYGRINDCTLQNGGGGMSLTAVDLAADVQDCYFGKPTQSSTTQTLGQSYKTLIRGALPNAEFGSFDANAVYPTPALNWENDRASACDSLAQQGNMFWYPLADGEFVLRQVAWTDNNLPIITYRDGNGGSLLAWSINYSRTNVFNSIIVSGELADGSTPVYGTAQDNDPASVTYINGNYGVKTQFVSIQGTVSPGSAATLANAYLAQAKAITETWGAQMVSDAALELGDPIQLLVYTGTTNQRTSSIQVVSAFTLSLDSRDTMNVSLRAQVPSSVTPIS